MTRLHHPFCKTTASFFRDLPDLGLVVALVIWYNEFKINSQWSGDYDDRKYAVLCGKG